RWWEKLTENVLKNKNGRHAGRTQSRAVSIAKRTLCETIRGAVVEFMVLLLPGRGSSAHRFPDSVPGPSDTPNIPGSRAGVRRSAFANVCGTRPTVPDVVVRARPGGGDTRAEVRSPSTLRPADGRRCGTFRSLSG